MTRVIRTHIILLFIFLLSHMLLSTSGATELTRSFLDAVKEYKQGNYDAAVDKFKTIVHTGVKNSKLYYNLGNSYLKNKDLGNAILWYERALKINPDDPDLHFNYQYALSLVKDQKDEDDMTIYRIIFFWKHYLSPSTIQGIAIFLNVIFWIFATLVLLHEKKKINFSARVYLLPVFLLTIIFTLTAFYNYYEVRYHKYAVILPGQVPVRSGLSADTTELFILHAGTKVKVEAEDKNHYKIFFSEGKIGWVKKSDAGLI